MPRKTATLLKLATAPLLVSYTAANPYLWTQNFCATSPAKEGVPSQTFSVILKEIRDWDVIGELLSWKVEEGGFAITPLMTCNTKEFDLHCCSSGSASKFTIQLLSPADADPALKKALVDEINSACEEYGNLSCCVSSSCCGARRQRQETKECCTTFAYVLVALCGLVTACCVVAGVVERCGRAPKAVQADGPLLAAIQGLPAPAGAGAGAGAAAPVLAAAEAEPLVRAGARGYGTGGVLALFRAADRRAPAAPLSTATFMGALNPDAVAVLSINGGSVAVPERASFEEVDDELSKLAGLGAGNA